MACCGAAAALGCSNGNRLGRRRPRTRGHGSVQVETLEEGDEETYPKRGDRLVIHYTGWLEDGAEFDSTIESEPLSFTLGTGEVIRGWDEGLVSLSLGEKAWIFVPSEKAYGEEGHDSIPPNSNLEFDVELLAINGEWADESPQDSESTEESDDSMQKVDREEPEQCVVQ
mmetsp:Transcript_40094/g.63640  ORF Transcript_40094/g.63640 Transcript_40094/m.63640 type:complete len:170 (+) Transcript_40094:13-522(+)